MELRDRVIAICEERLGIKAGAIKGHENISADLGADSLDLVELIMALEEEFGISIIHIDAEEPVTVDELIELVTKLV